VKPDQGVTAILDAYPDWQIPGKVRTVIPTADRQKATVKVRIEFTADDHKKLIDPAVLQRGRPDMGVKVTFLEEEKRNDAKAKEDKSPVIALVPQNAIHQEGSSSYVFVVKGNTLERRGVQTGQNRGGDVEILAGIQSDSVVVVKGPGSLRDGQAVQIKQQ